MKNLTFTLLSLLIVSVSIAQKKYFRTNGEYIFSFSEVSDNNISIDSKMRFSFFFHLGEYFHYDINNKLGFYSGIGIRNIGIITNNAGSTIMQRSYSTGIPIAIKLGQLNNNSFFFAGGEYEYLFHYKEKTIDNNGKSIYRSWNSDKINTLLPSVFAGIQFKRGLNLKFKYYLLDFLNQKYTETINNQITQPYSNLKTQLFNISITFDFNKYKIKDLKKLNPIKKEPKTIEV